MNDRSSYFSVCSYKVTTERSHAESDGMAEAIVEVRIGPGCVRRSARGVGPIHALDNALRACLRNDFPELEEVRLSDYKVSVVGAGAGTAAHVRVVIEATDGKVGWEAASVSANIVDASFEALCSVSSIGITRSRDKVRRSA